MSDLFSEERALARRMVRGDERAFDTFFDRYFGPLFRFTQTRVGGDADLTEELVQRTLCSAVTHIGSWRGEAQLLTWLCAICRREIATHFRRVGRAPSWVELTEEQPEVRAALESLRAGEGDPEQRALRSELIDLVHVALDRLPPHYAQALELKYLEGHSMKEIAARVGTSAKAVESLLTRARGAYRDVLAALLAGAAVLPHRGGGQ